MVLLVAIYNKSNFMLQVFRDSAHKWFVKLLFWLLVLSFGLWGIGDVVYKLFANKPIAKVGKRSISYEEFNHELQKQSSQIQALAQGKITPEQLKAIGIHNIAINRLVDEAAIQEELEELNLSVSEEMVKDLIHSQKAFQTDGKFDANRFLSILQNRGMHENSFVKEFRFNVLQQQYMASLAYGAQLPEFYTDTILDALTREFVFAVVEIKANKIKADKKATTEQLQTFYDQHKNNYSVPEYRDISFIKINNSTLSKLLNITDQQIKAAYENKKDEFKYPERRTIKHLQYTDATNAKKAHQMATDGVNFEKIKKAVPGGKLEEIKLSAKLELPDFAADKIFATNKGETTEIIEDSGVYHVFLISEIEAEHSATFSEVKSEIENSLIQEQKNSKIEEIRNQIDDALAAGRNLQEIASDLKLSVTNIAAVSAQGTDTVGKNVFSESDNLKEMIIQKAFTTEQGLDSGLVDVPNEGLFILTVNKVSPAYIPALDQVKEKAQADYAKEKQLEEAAQIAHTMAYEAKSLNTLMEMANRNDCEFSTNHTMTRLEIGKKDRTSYDLITPSLAERAFLLAPETAIAERNGKDGFTVIMLQKVGKLKSDKKNSDNIKTNLNSGIKEDVASLTIDGLRAEHAAEINQEMLAKMAE
jgi:peptidyl-prolyl cis-trans isomerase D